MAAAEPVARVWTHTDGRKLTAALLGIEFETVVLRSSEGAPLTMPLTQLSEGDQSFLRAWQRERLPEAALPPVVWPGEISAGTVALSAPVREEERWVMNTVNYHFICETELATSAVQDLASVGEATRRWLRAWPLPMPELPANTRAVARLFKNKASYEAAGGPVDSGGFFRGRWGNGELLVPYESLGLEPNPNGNGYRKSLTFSPRTLVHEMTHQQMAPLLPLLPLWLSEGLAELAALPEYRGGKFRVSRELMLGRLRQRWEEYETRDPVTGAKSSTAPRTPASAWTIPLETLCSLDETSPAWLRGTLADKHRFYLTSLIVSYYFLYLEGDGQARRLRLYWQDLLQAQRYVATRGQSGNIPPGIDPHLPALQEALTARLFGSQTLRALQVDLRKRCHAVGMRVEFPPS